MFMFYQLGSGRIVADGLGSAFFPADVSWQPLFKVDPAGGVYRVAPVFGDATSAVTWLRDTVRGLRKFPWYQRKQLPNFAFPDPRRRDMWSELGLGGLHNYSDLADSDGFPIPTFLFRGQEDIWHSFLPTLCRSLWPPIALGKGPFSVAKQANEAEQTLTSQFVKKFFRFTNWSGRKTFPWLREMSLPRRAAIARHYGFYSWTMDFTLDPGIAAWFATGGGHPREGLGVIYVVDEHHLRSLFGKSQTIVNHTGFQRRSWDGIPIEKIHQNTAVLDGDRPIGSLISDFSRELKTVRRDIADMNVQLSYTPGKEVDRMWQQKWCGLEVTCHNSTWSRTVSCYQIFARMIGCVAFRQTGRAYEEEGITARDLLNPDDSFSRAVESFKERHGLAPGEHTRAYLAAIEQC